MQKIRFILLVLASCFIWQLSTDFLSIKASAQRQVEKSAMTIIDNGVLYYVHTASRREKLSDIANAYNVTVRAIKEENPSLGDYIKRKQTIMIPTTILEQMAKEEEEARELEEAELAKLEEEKFTAEKLALSQGEGEMIDELYSSEEYWNEDLINEAVESVEFGLTAEIPNYGALKIALLLPFKESSLKSDANFVQFYRGVLIALEQVSSKSGREINLEVLSTGNSPQRVEELIREGKLSDKNLIIGPIYPKEFEVAAKYAALKRIAIVSPLGSVGSADNPFVVEVAPTEESKWDDIIPIITNEDANVIVIEHQTLQDNETYGELSTSLPMMAKKVMYQGKYTNIERLSEVLELNRENVIIVPISNEIAVEEILSRYSSANALGRYNIRVIGTSKWARFDRVNLELFYKLGVTYPTSYYFERMDKSVRDFYGEYIKRFRSIPNLYLYRGYDVAKIFAELMIERGDKMLYGISAGEFTELLTPYKFSPGDRSDKTGVQKIVNNKWATVSFNRNYTVTLL